MMPGMIVRIFISNGYIAGIVFYCITHAQHPVEKPNSITTIEWSVATIAQSGNKSWSPKKKIIFIIMLDTIEIEVEVF